ncbi:hypothetical protein ACHHYP_06476 [Achlya hypogyna]|uniref:Secreted protein n=1 Tax=Achlya hypogyna TaxID=1202772 RepID=A0A0A7CNM7_ACHHY|nr:secreted protein [Achlya hypogyna]OQR89091.1 hypothetical protein ACHHYP_06476 [Achlya hypogyna]
MKTYGVLLLLAAHVEAANNSTTTLVPCDQASLVAATTPVNSGPVAQACLGAAKIKDMSALFTTPLTPTQAGLFTSSPKCQTWYTAYTGVLATLPSCAMPNGANVRSTATVPFANFLPELEKAANATKGTNASTSVVVPGTPLPNNHALSTPGATEPKDTKRSSSSGSAVVSGATRATVFVATIPLTFYIAHDV